MKKHLNNVMLVCVAVTLSLCGWLYADEPVEPDRVHPHPYEALNKQFAADPSVATSQPAENAWEKALNKTLTKINFTEMPLNKVMDIFQEETGLNIVVKWQSLANAHVDKATKINIKLKNLPARVVLRAILEAASPVDAPLDFTIKNGILIVSTAEDLATPRMLITRVYDVTDLFDGTVPEQADALVENIRGNIAPDTWGDSGHISYLSGGLLTITQTYRNQRAVKKLLSDLRKTGIRIQSSPTAQARQAEPRIKLVSNMKALCQDPQAMGIIAIGGLRTEIPQKREELIETLVSLLENTKALSLRNAIRLTLKDLYVEKGDAANALKQLKLIIRENDRAMRKPLQDAARLGPGAAAPLAPSGFRRW